MILKAESSIGAQHIKGKHLLISCLLTALGLVIIGVDGNLPLSRHLSRGMREPIQLCTYPESSPSEKLKVFQGPSAGSTQEGSLCYTSNKMACIGRIIIGNVFVSGMFTTSSMR